MKKFFYLSVFVILTLFIVAFNYFKINSKYITNKCSQIEYNYFNFKNEKYNVILTSGIREDNFDYDGISNSKKEYGIVKLIIYGFTDYAKNIDIILKINGKNNNYILEKNPFDNSFMCDTETIFSKKDELKIFVNNLDNYFNKINVISDKFKINYKKALNICFNELKTYIKQNKLCECYLIIQNNKDNNFYWLFKVFTPNFNTKMVMINTNNGEIVLKN